MHLKHLLLASLGISLLLSCKNTPPPAPVLPVPTPEQIEWHKMETYAFVHFGLNTFNDEEWGYGDTPASKFNPERINCDQWAAIFKAAGLKGVILTTKHHDGFCLWPTATTAYSIKNSPWKDGKGDMVKDLSDACRRQGLKFGVYLSPWDRNSAAYGTEEYVKIFHAQMKELLTNYGPIFEYWFDGANGGNGWYGGTNETRSIDAKTYYRYEDARKVIKELHPKAMIFGGTVPDIRWIGNEEGWAGQTNWAPFSPHKEHHFKQNQWGMEDGDEWLGGECDLSIRPGWFYHAREDHQVRSLARLVDLYYMSVGRNANFLLSFPVNLDGNIHPTDSARAVEWYQTIRNELKDNVLKNIKISASDTRGNDKKYQAAHAIDGNWDTYWATNDGITQGSLTLTFEKPTAINRLMIQEYIPLGQRVKSFRVEIEQDGKWNLINTADSTTTIGYKRILRFQTVEAEKIKINFTDAKGPLCINNIEAFLAPALVTEPIITRNDKNEIHIRANDRNTEVYYTTDGTDPTLHSSLYKDAFSFPQQGIIKAFAYDKQFDKKSPVSSLTVDIPVECYQVIKPADKNINRIFDGNGYTAIYLPADNRELIINLDQARTISGFLYTPNQGRDASGHISNYQFFVDNKLVTEGEFSNIKHNPIRQEIHFTPVKGKQVKLKATRIIDNGKRAGIAEFSLITK